MADEGAITDRPEYPEPRQRGPVRKVLRGVGYAIAGVVAAIVLFIGFLHTPPGRQFLLDEISSFAPASGLSVEVGSIEGSVLWSATFHDVKLRDANDTLFLEVPTVDLNWRPWKWPFTGLDVRHLVLTGGTLYAAPQLEPGDPDAPLLPDFDIRVDNLLIEDLRVAEGLLGEERVINFRAEADIRQGKVHLDSSGEFGGADRFSLLVDAEPDGDIFDLDLDWQAPAGGFLATMTGAEEDLSIRLDGDGRWTAWQGQLLATQGGDDLLDFDIYNEAGQYRLVGHAYPGDYVEGLTADALGEEVAFTASGTLVDSVLEGNFALRGRAFDLDGAGGVNLADNAFEDLALEATLLDSTLFGEGMTLDDAHMTARLDGAFNGFEVPHTLSIGRLAAGETLVENLRQQGTISFENGRAIIPLDMQVGRVVSGVEMFDPRLVNGTVAGTLTYGDGQLMSDNLAIRFTGLDAALGLRGDLNTGRFTLAGPVDANDLVLADIGRVDAIARINFAIGGGVPWTLNAALTGQMDRVDNATIETLAGQNIRFNGGLSLGENRPISFTGFRVNGSNLLLTVDGRLVGDQTILTGTGRHVEYGAFTFDATIDGDGPRAELVLADPLPAAGLKDVRVALAPSGDGFAIETSGQSLLGAFDGNIDLVMPSDGQTQIAIRRLDVSGMQVTGELDLVEGGVNGGLTLAGGGVDGRIGLVARPTGQAFDVDLTARNASFGGATPLTIARGEVDARGFIGDGTTTVQGEMTAQGISYGTIFLGRMAANAEVTNGTGTFNAALAGQRGSRFELLVNGQATPQRIAVAARGSYADEDITMPRRAVLLKTDDGGWELQRTQIGYGGGYAIAQGRFGGDQPAEGRLSLSDMPLALADAASDSLGLGGTISGVVEFAGSENGLPTGQARVMIDGLTRSGLLLTSRPMNVAIVADLSPTLLQARAAMSDAGSVNGRIDARIANLPQSGALADRLYAGDLFAQLRYDGSASALWRLAALDFLDVTGEVQVAANARGSLGNPQVRGSLQGDGLRVQSALTGSDISDVSARGRFDGSRLQLTSFSGTAPNGGRVSGSGFVDLSNIDSTRGPQIDLRLAARNAQILQLPGMGATVTGPIRLVSDGVGGTIAGRLQINQATWKLGTADEAVDLPDIDITEVNFPADVAPPGRAAQPWRYLINATARSGVKVSGMGLDSEWRGDIRLRGTTEDPRIGGQVNIVPRQGFYSFAGVRFEITRGNIDFEETAPPDPRLDILAEADVNDISVDVTVRGSASQPEITFASVPALPEEELLARLLFGGSITDLSATDALQLGAALASLRGGSGVDPINRLRSAIGLDRLRIVPADAALDRGTSIALGKNISRRFYAEIITDGQGYNATELEFRVTSWLSLLGSISTVGRGAVEAEFSRDY